MINFSTQILLKYPLTNFVFYLFAFLVLCACEGHSLMLVRVHFSRNQLILETFGVSAPLDDFSYHAGQTENLRVTNPQGKEIKILGETQP